MLHRFCGPRAIAALTGLTREEAAARVIAYRQQRPRYHGSLQRGSTYLHEVLAALRAAGCTPVREPFAGTVGKLLRWLDEEGGRWLVLVPGHWFAVVDGATHSTRQESPRSKVLTVYRVVI